MIKNKIKSDRLREIILFLYSRNTMFVLEDITGDIYTFSEFVVYKGTKYYIEVKSSPKIDIRPYLDKGVYSNCMYINIFDMHGCNIGVKAC